MNASVKWFAGIIIVGLLSHLPIARAEGLALQAPVQVNAAPAVVTALATAKTAN